jgi:hypothetical protein
MNGIDHTGDFGLPLMSYQGDDFGIRSVTCTGVTGVELANG